MTVDVSSKEVCLLTEMLQWYLDVTDAKYQFDYVFHAGQQHIEIQLYLYNAVVNTATVELVVVLGGKRET